MTNLDDELVEVTDALLDGREMKPLEGENAALQVVVRQIYEVIDPRRAPGAEFQQRLVARLGSEWDRSYTRPTLRLMDRPWARVSALAAAVVLVLAALIVLAVPDSPEQLQGAAIGFDDAAAVVVLIGVAAVSAFVYWRRR